VIFGSFKLTRFSSIKAIVYAAVHPSTSSMAAVGAANEFVVR
jgi:hypothetical protein